MPYNSKPWFNDTVEFSLASLVDPKTRLPNRANSINSFLRPGPLGHLSRSASVHDSTSSLYGSPKKSTKKSTPSRFGSSSSLLGPLGRSRSSALGLPKLSTRSCPDFSQALRSPGRALPRFTAGTAQKDTAGEFKLLPRVDSAPGRLEHLRPDFLKTGGDDPDWNLPAWRGDKEERFESCKDFGKDSAQRLPTADSFHGGTGSGDFGNIFPELLMNAKRRGWDLPLEIFPAAKDPLGPWDIFSKEAYPTKKGPMLPQSSLPKRSCELFYGTSKPRPVQQDIIVGAVTGVSPNTQTLVSWVKNALPN